MIGQCILSCSKSRKMYWYHSRIMNIQSIKCNQKTKNQKLIHFLTSPHRQNVALTASLQHIYYFLPSVYCLQSWRSKRHRFACWERLLKSFLNTSCGWFSLTTGPVQPCNQVFHDACWWSKSSLLLVDFIYLQDPDSVSPSCCALHIIHKEAREALWVSSLDWKP